MYRQFKFPAVLLAVASLMSLAASETRADLIVTIGNATISQGGTGFVDVFVHSSTGADLLNFFTAEFGITTSGSTALWFANPQSDAQLGNANYVFAGDSAAQTSSTPVATIGPNTLWSGVDATQSGNDVSVGLTDKLLARLDLTTVTSSAPGAGDTFTISLLNNGNTFFGSIATNPVPFSSFSGTVNINGSAATPEPSSMLLMAMGMGGAAAAKRWRRRSEKPESNG